MARSPTRKVEQLAEAAAATVTATAAALDAALPRKSAGELYREAAGGDDEVDAGGGEDVPPVSVEALCRDLEALRGQHSASIMELARHGGIVSATVASAEARGP